jgi:hypothetical protein
MRRAANLNTFMCRLSRNSGVSASRNPKGLSRPVAGKLYFTLHSTTLQTLRDRRLPPRLNWILPSYALLRGIKWVETDVSGLYLKMRPVGYSETSVSNHITQHNNPEKEYSLQVLLAGFFVASFYLPIEISLKHFTTIFFHVFTQ